MLFHKIKSALRKGLSNTFPTATLYLRKFLKKGMEKEMELLPFFCDKEKSSIDVGAHNGIYSLLLSKLSGQVYSFEPLPFLYAYLEKAFRKLSNVRIYAVGLSNRTGSEVIYSPEKLPGWSTLEKNNKMLEHIKDKQKINEYRIETRKLDDFDFRNISFIKIDVEGHESEVIKGAKETILKNKPVMLIEIEEKHVKGSVKNVIEYIKQTDDYSSYYYSGGKLVKFDDFDAEKHKGISGEDEYIYNFIFIHDRSEVNLSLIKDGLIVN